MAEDKKCQFKGEINEQDIEKENLRPSEIDGVAGGIATIRSARPEVNQRPAVTTDMEDRAPARNAPDEALAMTTEDSLQK